MKHTKRTLTILLAALMLSSCLLPMAGCTGTTTAPESPFNDAVPTDKDKGNDQTIGNTDKPADESGDNTTDENGDGNAVKDPSSFIDPDAAWSQDSITGEKRLYGKQNLYDPSKLVIGNPITSLLRYGDMCFGEIDWDNKMGYFSFDEPNDARLLCFDPVCKHYPQDGTCTSCINYYQGSSGGGGPAAKPGEKHTDPMNWYIDYYESTEGPVFYYYYRCSEYYTVGREQEAKRDPLYCIERYSLAEGKRTTLIENVENTISVACNYGDYIYYVLDMGDGKGKELHKLDKTGKEVAMLEFDGKTTSLDLIDVVDDAFYYLIDEQYLYRCTLDLTDNEMVLDLSTLRGKDDSIGIVQGSYSGYLYYIADVEEVEFTYLNTTLSDEKANLYRIPMNDLEKTPELVVEGMNFTRDTYMFAEKTLYYSLCTAQAGEKEVNLSDGKLMALDLTTGESKTIVEDSDMNIYIQFAWDDMAIVTGRGYTKEGQKNTGELEGIKNYMFVYASGKQYEFWTTKFGDITDEYTEYLDSLH